MCLRYIMWRYSIVVLGLLVACAASPIDDIVEMPTIVQYQLLSMQSGRFVGVTGDGCIHAMGIIRDPRTKFIPRFTSGGNIAFEAYCMLGRYIIFEKNATRVRLGIPSNDSEIFEQNSPFPGTYAYKSRAVEGQDCYLSFDLFGNAHKDELLCVTTMSHMGTLFSVIESVEEADCEQVQLKSSRLEL